MVYLGRKVNPGKWRDARDKSADIPADRTPAIVFLNKDLLDLRANENRLSFWQSTESAADAVEVATLAHAANLSSLDNIDVTWIERAPLEAAGVEFEPTQGETPVAELQQKHVEAIRLDVFGAARIAAAVSAAVDAAAAEPGRLRTMTLEEVRTLLLAAIETGRVQTASLKKGVKEALGLA
jgi:ribosomal protein L12E/L44/L45/RPP1/RPP2